MRTLEDLLTRSLPVTFSGKIVFGTILISVITLMHIYVFWRTASVPLIARLLPQKILIGIGLLLWAVFFLGRVYGHHRTGVAAATLEFIGMNWMAMLFLLFIALLAVDLVTGFGFLLPRMSPSLRGWALIAGALLSMIAIIQGLRPPVVRSYEVRLPELPAQLDGLVLLAMSDLHADSLPGNRWLAARVAQVQAQRPHLVVLLGDIFEGHGPPPDKLLATILLSHTPWQAEKAAGAGTSLMLSGHTHGGQIWPFGYLVRRVYPLLAGRYQVNNMAVIVCRGTGTWGPRMRLWQPGEILRITLTRQEIKSPARSVRKTGGVQ